MDATNADDEGSSSEAEEPTVNLSRSSSSEEITNAMGGVLAVRRLPMEGVLAVRSWTLLFLNNLLPLRKCHPYTFLHLLLPMTPCQTMDSAWGATISNILTTFLNRGQGLILAVQCIGLGNSHH